MVASINVSGCAGHAEESVLVVVMTAMITHERVCRLPWLATWEDTFEGECVSIRRTYSR